jgi:transposase-like protein
MQLYFTGESLRSIQKFLNLRGIKVTHVSIYNRIRRIRYIKDLMMMMILIDEQTEQEKATA